MGTVVEVFKAKQMPIFDKHFPVCVEQVPRQAARLGTSTTIGTTVADMLAQIALPAVADAQRAMDEKFQRNGGFFANFMDLLQTQLTTQNDLAKAQVFKQLHFFHGQVVALGAGVEGNGGQVKFEEFHILNNEGIHASVPAVVGQLSGAFQLAII